MNADKMIAPKKIGFMIHPRETVAADMGQLFGAPAGWIPNRAYEVGLRKLPIPPLVTGKMAYDLNGQTVDAGWLITVPLTPTQLLTMDRKTVHRKLHKAADKARDLGASVVGLGALTAPAALGGKVLDKRQDIGITNGNAFTAAMTFEAVKKIIDANRVFGKGFNKIAIVGATGSVGTCLTKLLDKNLIHGSDYSSLLLIARNTDRLTKLQNSLSASDHTSISTYMSDLQKADLIILVTSAAEAIIESKYLKAGAIILDDTMPRNTRRSLLEERPDILIIDGGIVESHALKIRGTIGLPKGHLYACLAETLLLGLEGHEGHFSIGNATLENAEYILRASKKYSHLGFGLADFTSFNSPLESLTPNSKAVAAQKDIDFKNGIGLPALFP